MAGACGLLAAIAWGASLTLHYQYQDEVDKVLTRAEQTAQRLAHRTTEVFDQVNQTTLLIPFLSQGGEPHSLLELDRAGVLPRNLTRSVLIADARGNVVDSTSGEVPLSIADEDDFKRLRNRTDLDLIVGLPAKNPLTSQWSIPVSRRIVKPDGGFGGVVTAAVDPAMLSLSFSLSEAPTTALGVLGRDGIYRARAVGGAVTFGEKVDIAALERRALFIREDRTPLVSVVDGISRFIVRVDVERYPLMTVVAVDATSALAEFARSKQIVLAWAATLGILIIGAASGLCMQAARLDRSRAAVSRSERAFRATIEGCLDAVTILQAERLPSGRLLDLVVLDVNARAAEFLGYARDEVIGRRVCELAPSLRTQGFMAQFENVIQTSRPRSSEVQATEPQIAGRWLHHQIVPLDDGVALITRDVTEKKEAERALAALARFDPLTQLSNRRHFEESLQSARARALRSGDTLGLVYIDLDGFKKINDTFGHEGGDLLLVAVARRLLGCIRSTDIVSRLGGDEFTIILEGAGDERRIRETCDRILQTLAEDHLIDGHRARATASIGAIVLTDAESCESMRRRADEAMYAAKRAGKARHCLVYSPPAVDELETA